MLSYNQQSEHWRKLKADPWSVITSCHGNCTVVAWFYYLSLHSVHYLKLPHSTVKSSECNSTQQQPVGISSNALALGQVRCWRCSEIDMLSETPAMTVAEHSETKQLSYPTPSWRTTHLSVVCVVATGAIVNQWRANMQNDTLETRRLKV